MTDPQTIVEGMTRARKRAILGGHETLFGNHIVLSARLDPRVADGLMNAGLAVLHDPYRLRLTDNGMAVRTHLEKESKK